MKKYKEFQEFKLKDMHKTDLQSFINEEVEDLWNDFGQKIDEEQLKHIAHRLYEVFTTKYSRWPVGTVHAAFQTGLTGGYGTSYKINVKTLFAWLSAAQKQMIHMRSSQAEQESERNKNFALKDDTKETQFIAWATGEMICLADFDPEHDPMQTRRVSPKISQLAEKYMKVKNDKNALFNFRAKLREKKYENSEL